MNDTLSCTCGHTQMEATGPPILSCECACESCREAAETLSSTLAAVDPRGQHGTTHFVLVRKDRVRCVSGADKLAEYRLTAGSKTRRVVATCCNTPVFLEFSGGHWLSMYAGLWPAHTRPAAEMRTMAGDLPAGVELPHDLPNSRTHSARFMWKLAAAWVAMGFRAPAIDYVEGGRLNARSQHPDRRSPPSKTT